MDNTKTTAEVEWLELSSLAVVHLTHTSAWNRISQCSLICGKDGASWLHTPPSHMRALDDDMRRTALAAVRYARLQMVTPDKVRQVRNDACTSIINARNALLACGGDPDKAITALQRRGGGV